MEEAMDSDPIVERLSRLVQPEAAVDPASGKDSSGHPPRDQVRGSGEPLSVVDQGKNTHSSDRALGSADHGSLVPSKIPNDSVSIALELLRDEIAAQHKSADCMEQDAKINHMMQFISAMSRRAKTIGAVAVTFAIAAILAAVIAIAALWFHIRS